MYMSHSPGGKWEEEVSRFIARERCNLAPALRHSFGFSVLRFALARLSSGANFMFAFSLYPSGKCDSSFDFGKRLELLTELSSYWLRNL